MGNLNNLFHGNVTDSKVFLGMTIDEANEFVKHNIVYKELNYLNREDEKITEICDKGLKDLRLSKGNMRLNVDTNSYGKITKINELG